MRVGTHSVSAGMQGRGQRHGSVSWNSRLTAADRCSLAVTGTGRTMQTASAAQISKPACILSPNLAPGSSVWHQTRDSRPGADLRPMIDKGEAPMSRTLLVIAGVAALLWGAHGAFAFTIYPVDPVTTSEPQAGPQQFSDRTSNGQSGGTTFGLPGGLSGGF